MILLFQGKKKETQQNKQKTNEQKIESTLISSLFLFLDARIALSTNTKHNHHNHHHLPLHLGKEGEKGAGGAGGDGGDFDPEQEVRSEMYEHLKDALGYYKKRKVFFFSFFSYVFLSHLSSTTLGLHFRGRMHLKIGQIYHLFGRRRLISQPLFFLSFDTFVIYFIQKYPY